jgi:glycosyltransferase involved in cell wall biosynthesis
LTVSPFERILLHKEQRVGRSVSCTILAYNEEATLEDATRDVVTALSAFGDREFEVLIVDDGSSDRTPEIAREMASRYAQVRVITHPENRGPGSGLITGFSESKNEVICFHAADQQFHFSDVAVLIPLLDEADLVIVSRTARPGYSAMRLVSSHIYIALVHLLFGLRKYEDFNYLYLYRREVLDRIQIETKGVFMCTELLVKAVDSGAKVATATVTCLPRCHGKATCGSPAVIGQTFLQMVGFWAKWRVRKLLGVSV